MVKDPEVEVARSEAAPATQDPGADPTAPTDPTDGPAVHHDASLPFTDATANVARRELLAQLDPLGVPRACVEDAVTILHELVRNGLDHGRACAADTLSVAWDLVDGELTLAVTDCGTATVAEQPWREKRLTPVQPDALRGRGLHLVAALSHDWHVRTTLADTTVTACVRVPRGE